jgi:hypothetical protein
MSKKFEVRQYKENGIMKRNIFIEGELFDFSVDNKSLLEAAKMGKEYLIAAKKDLQNYFLKSLSEVVGRKLTEQDIKNAFKTGLI